MEFPVRGSKVATLEKEKLNLPEPGIVNGERIWLGPVLAVRKSDGERGPSRSVDLDGLIVARRCIMEELHADEVDPNRVTHAGVLVVRDGKGDGPRLGDIEIRRIGRSAPGGAENVKL